MEISQELIENTIWGEYLVVYFPNDSMDQETFEELNKIVIVENIYEEKILRVIKSIKLHNYKDARSDVYMQDLFAKKLYQKSWVIKSLLKGIITTSSLTSLSEIKDAQIRWSYYNDRQDAYDPQGNHNQVYLEFKKVENLEGLARFNIYLHNYILNLVFELSESYIPRLRYTIEYFKDNETFEEACTKGNMKLEKFILDLQEIKYSVQNVNE
jgi:hypothetical protein